MQSVERVTMAFDNGSTTSRDLKGGRLKEQRLDRWRSHGYAV